MHWCVSVFECNMLYINVINVHFQRPLKIRKKCAKSAGDIWGLGESTFATYYTPFFYTEKVRVLCIWMYMDVYIYMGQYVQAHQMVQILIHFVGRYPNDNLTQPMAQFGGLAWGQQYLQQILPRKVEEVSAKTGKRWAVTVTMSKKCWQATAMNLAFWGWLIQSFNTWWWFIWDGSLVPFWWPLDTHFSHQNWCPQGSPVGSQVTYPPRGEGLVAQAAGTPQAGRLFVFCVHRQLGRIFQVLLVAEAIAIHMWKRLGGNKMQ